MNIRIEAISPSVTQTITLADNAAARDFHTMLPLTANMEDYAGKEKIARLPRTLTIAGVPTRHDAKRGDFTYYAPWGNLALFYRDHGEAAAGLVYLGRIDDGLEALTQLQGTVHFRAVQESVAES